MARTNYLTYEPETSPQGVPAYRVYRGEDDPDGLLLPPSAYVQELVRNIPQRGQEPRYAQARPLPSAVGGVAPTAPTAPTVPAAPSPPAAPREVGDGPRFAETPSPAGTRGAPPAVDINDRSFDQVGQQVNTQGGSSRTSSLSESGSRRVLSEDNARRAEEAGRLREEAEALQVGAAERVERATRESEEFRRGEEQKADDAAREAQRKAQEEFEKEYSETIKKIEDEQKKKGSLSDFFKDTPTENLLLGIVGALVTGYTAGRAGAEAKPENNPLRHQFNNWDARRESRIQGLREKAGMDTQRLARINAQAAAERDYQYRSIARQVAGRFSDIVLGRDADARAREELQAQMDAYANLRLNRFSGSRGALIESEGGETAVGTNPSVLRDTPRDERVAATSAESGSDPKEEEALRLVEERARMVREAKERGEPPPPPLPVEVQRAYLRHPEVRKSLGLDTVPGAAPQPAPTKAAATPATPRVIDMDEEFPGDGPLRIARKSTKGTPVPRGEASRAFRELDALEERVRRVGEPGMQRDLSDKGLNSALEGAVRSEDPKAAEGLLGRAILPEEAALLKKMSDNKHFRASDAFSPRSPYTTEEKARVYYLSREIHARRKLLEEVSNATGGKKR